MIEIVPYRIQSGMLGKTIRSKYRSVYERLVELRNGEIPQGAFVPFSTRKQGEQAVRKMRQWARGDGFVLLSSAHADNGRYLELHKQL